MNAVQPGRMVEEVFVGGGEMGALMRSHDWSQTPLGTVENWSQSLKAAINICINSRFPMVVWWGKELTLLYNDAWQPMLGNKHPQALGKPGQEVWSEIWDIVGLQLQSVLATGEATWSDDQLLLVNRYGYIEEAYFTYSYSPIFTETGAVGGAFTAVAETTQRVIGERRLATLRNLAAQTGQSKTVEQAYQMAMQTLAENPSDIPFALLYQLNAEGTQAILQNQTPLELHSLVVPIEINLAQPNHPLARSIASVVEHDQPVLLESVTQQWGNFLVGQSQIPVQQAIVLPIRASTQDVMLGMVVIGINPYQALNPDHHNFLEMTVGHIANAIASARAYEEERKRAEALAELDRAKTTFFSNISHEFRTPLTLMISPLEAMMATEDGISDEQKQQLELIHRNSLRLLKLVNTLLDFSRIEAGRVQAVYQPTDLAALTAELASVFRSAIEQVGLQLIVNCQSIAEPVYVDREMWEKIILNLLSNAFKYTFVGEIAVTLKQVGNQVELTVRDTGIGIPAAELPHLFERFHRVVGAQGRTQEGSGIGLALVQELVRLHGGQIQVESIEGKGTAFVITIPLGTAHLPADRIQAPSMPTTAIGAAPYVEEALRWLPEDESSQFSVVNFELETNPAADQLQWSNSSIQNSNLKTQNSQLTSNPAKILLVDDNTDMRNYVARLLLHQGYEVTTAVNGRVALQVARQHIPDLILTDVMMPLLDGFGLLRELRSTPETRNIPIILLSARAGEEARVEGLEAGADDYLIKPFSARELMARVEANLKLTQLRREATQREQALRLTAETAQQQVEAILSSINDGFLVLDRNWCYTYINDRNCEIIGMSRSEVLGKNIWELFPDVVGTEVYQHFHQSLAEQTPIQFEYFYPTWNRWFEYRLYPAAAGLTVFVADISDRKRVEANLHQSEASFRLIAETIQDVFWVSDFRIPKILYVSPAYEQIWGRSPTEVYQNYDLWAETIHPEDREQVLQIAATCHNDEIVEQEYRIVRPDGSVRWIRDRGFAVHDETGQISQVVGVAQDITDYKLALAALQQSEAKFRRLVEVSMFGVAIGDFSGKMIYANDSLLHMIGYSREELETGQIHWIDLTPPKHLHLDWQAGQELRQRGICKAFEKEYIHKDGHRVPILIGGALLGEPYTDQEQVISFYLDLTELKQTEATLREQQTLLETILKQAADGIIVCDATGKLTFVNREARRLAHQDLDDPNIDLNLLDWGTAYDTDGNPIPLKNYAISKALRGEPSNVLEARMIRKDGSYYDILVGAASLRNHDQQIVGAVVTFIDITQRKQTETALLESEERLRLALTAANQGLYDLNVQTGDAIVSPEYARMLGYEPEELEESNTKWRDRLHPDDVAVISQAYEDYISGKLDTYRVEFRQRTKSEDWKWILSIGKIVEWDRDGQPLRMLGTHTDITERKQVEQQREQLLVREQAAREAAETANRIKDEFLAVLSHELRSPLNPILGWSKLLQVGKLDTQTSRYALETIERNAKLQTQLIEDLLDVSRILRGKMGLNRCSVDLVMVIESALETVRLAVEAKAINLQFTSLSCASSADNSQPNSKPQTPKFFISGDSARLQQIVWNLLSNAVKFTPSGGRVEVRLEKVIGNCSPVISEASEISEASDPSPTTHDPLPITHYAQITVSDNGKGIHPNFLPYVFDYFRQEDGKTTRKFGGLGLGLAIVRHLTELHGGTVDASSPGEGQGATFTVKLPLMPAPPEPDQPVSSPRVADLNQLQIMVVDDEPDMRDLVKIILEQQGAQVMVATSAEEALLLFEQHLPDVLISDIGMPGTDGYMLMQQIRRRSPTQGGRVPAIALTAYAAEYDQQRAIAAGFQQHLPKPIEPEVLINAIATLTSAENRNGSTN